MLNLCVGVDIDEPIQASGSSGGGGGSASASGVEPPAESVSMLADMGFTSMQAKKALRQTVSCTLSSLLSFT